MNDLQIFSNPEFGQVRTVELNGQPWLVGKDVAEALGYKNPGKAIIAHVDEEDKRFEMLSQGADSQNGNVSPSSKTALINESGLYSLILSSKMPKAKAFKHWVTSEVLPALRKNGVYETVKAQQHIEQLEATNERLTAAIKTVSTAKEQLAEVIDTRNDMLKQRDDFKVTVLEWKYRALVNSQITFRIPVIRFTESIIKAIRAEYFLTHSIQMTHYLQRIFRSIDNRG